MRVQAGALVRVVTFSYTPRQLSSTEVPMRLIGLAVILTLSLILSRSRRRRSKQGKSAG